MGSAQLRRALVTRGREVAAFARQAWLLRHDTGESVVPVLARDGDDVVVFMHGLFATAGVLRPLRSAIARYPGIHSTALSYAPGPGVVVLAERLAALIDSLPRGARAHLVGHSLGGIVMRYFAQEMGDPRVVQTISMASPFAGVPRARLLGFGGAKDLDESSPLLRQIVLGAERASHVPHLSIIAGADTLVRSPTVHALPFGDVVVLHDCGHNALLFDDDVVKIVAARVLDRRGG
jgi:triacylglycerol lipase